MLLPHETYGSLSSQTSLKKHDAPLEHTANSAALTAGLIIADVVGAGILAMAVAVSHVGWALGAIGLIGTLAMNVHICILMWRVRMAFPETQTYYGLVSAAFSKASPLVRKLWTAMTLTSQYVFIFCMLGLYMLSIGKGLGNLFYFVHACLPVWAMIGAFILLPFHITARRLGKWQSLIWLNVVTIVGTTTIPLVSMAINGVENTRPANAEFYAVAPLTLAGTFATLSSFTFAFTSQFMVTEIIAEMKDPSEFPKSYISMAVPFQLVAFLAVGLIGYYYMGSSVAGMIGDNIPFGYTFQLAAICLLTHMLITYMIKGIVLCRAIQAAMNVDMVEEDTHWAWCVWSIIVVSTMSLAYILSQIVPFFADAVDLLGASLTPVSCYLIPIAIYLRYLRDFNDDGTLQISNVEYTIILLEATFAIVLCLVGTYYAMVAIVENWHTYGPPFACHCEGMWNSCECSQDHAGMRDQCPVVPGHALNWRGPL